MTNEKVVLITGASRGIGRATAIKYAQEGYNVVLDYIDNERDVFHAPNIDNERDIKALKKLIETKYKVKALAIKADVSCEAEVNEMFKQIKKQFGKMDCLVNNAGIVYDREFKDITIAEFERVLKVNVMGAFIVARAATKIMKHGAIVNVSSTNGTKTISPECLDYNISKIGLQSLTRDLAFQLKPNIRVNAIAIGWADTSFNSGLADDYKKEEENKIWLGNFAKPEQIADTIFYLNSPQASYINGEIVNIDGGYC